MLINTQLFCPVPFTNISLEPNGDVGVCQQKGNDFLVGSLQTQSLEEIWNGEKMRGWREEFLVVKPKTCSNEIRHQMCHLSQEEHALFKNNFVTTNQPRILKLTANFNGKCNLKCIMCDVWPRENGFYTEQNFWKWARVLLFPNLVEIKMLSGEPFIQADTYQLIQEVSTLNPSVKWAFTTNLNWRLNQKILAYLDQIDIKEFIVSIDGASKSTYERIRLQGRFGFVLKNLEALVKYQTKRNFNIYWNYLVQIDNRHELIDAFKLMSSFSITPFFTFLYRPHNLSLLSLSENERLDFINKTLDFFPSNDMYRLRRVILPVFESLSIENKKMLIYKKGDLLLFDKALV